MKVRKHHDPEAELGPGYAHDLYEFEEAGITYVARSYLTDSSQAHFLRKEVAGEMLGLSMEDVHTASFRRAVAYLRERGKAQVQYLSDTGYLEVPF